MGTCEDVSRKHWRISIHACERWAERIEPADKLTTWQARHRIQRVLRGAQRIPNRLAAARWVRKYQARADANFRKHGTRYYFTPNAVLVIGSKRTVVTVMEATPEDVATVLVWLMLGQWFAED